MMPFIVNEPVISSPQPGLGTIDRNTPDHPGVNLGLLFRFTRPKVWDREGGSPQAFFDPHAGIRPCRQWIVRRVDETGSLPLRIGRCEWLSVMEKVRSESRLSTVTPQVGFLVFPGLAGCRLLESYRRRSEP